MTVSDLARQLARTTRAQLDASDPQASVWVSANAGTGKTHVLTMRVLRLLLAGTSPERILCLTYTKAAASEMSKRVFDTLAQWVTASDETLTIALDRVLGRTPTGDERHRARTLFTSAIETPGGFKVQTIHAFAERLLQRFPLEAGVTPGFAILDELEADDLRREAIDAVLKEAVRHTKAPLGQALTTAVAYAAEDRFDEVLKEALRFRTWLDSAARTPERRTGDDAFWRETEGLFRSHFAIRQGATPETLAQDIAGLLSDADLERITLVFDQGSKQDVKRADAVRAVRHATSPLKRAGAMSKLLLDSNGEPRKSYLTKALSSAYPDVEALLQRTCGAFAPLWREMKGAEVVTATMALNRIAAAVLQNYQDGKASRAALDFDDLIVRTRNLLLTSRSAAWVLFKLDNGIDHLLVDESQDTSPEQWQVVEALAREFFAGSGTRETQRTIFAVGDEKQSIYSFQGAAPEMFAAMGKVFEKITTDSGARWSPVDLDVSFRTTAPILDAVDRVFSDSTRTPGVPQGRSGVRHIAKRIGQAGSAEIWLPEPFEAPDPGDAWAPLDETGSVAPEVRLAERIAQTIKTWIDTGEQLPSGARPIRAGDVLILVRKRRPFAGPMVAALKARGIAVAGADRLHLTQHIAVQDLMSLGNFLTLPEDDLALAEVLKSPIGGLDDDDLLRIAAGRKGTLWKALLDNADSDARLMSAADDLKRWRKAADFTPPYEFWAKLLDQDRVRSKLLARLGPDAVDPIDEFLNIALTYDDSAAPSLTGFLHALQQTDPEIKRDMDHSRDEVRVMTVHGAKGLEAPIVILPDTCSTGSNASGGRPIPLHELHRQPDTGTPFVWPVKGASDLPSIAAAQDGLRLADEAERNRLLYVALTRPRDRLIVAGYEGKKGRPANCWYNLVCDALGADPNSPVDPEGRIVWRSACAQTDAADQTRKEALADLVTEPTPDWARRSAPREKHLSVPLAPSRLAPYDTDETGEPVASEPPAPQLAEPAPSRPGSGAAGDRFLRGTLTHALLEHLPRLDPKTWETAAHSFLEARASEIPKRIRTGIFKEARAVLTDPAFGVLFGPQSRAEVPLVAEIPHPSGKGPALRLTGQIDRLAVTASDVLIADYKTNRGAPRSPEAVAEVYLLQLAAYRLALARIYPKHRIRAVLLWTEGPHLMEIPEEYLESATQRLWQADPSRLDGGATAT